MNPNDIKLDSLTLNFEYERLSRDIDSLNSIDDVKSLTKYFIRMYFLQQETISKLGKI
jgi:hypothetical protein